MAPYVVIGNSLHSRDHVFNQFIAGIIFGFLVRGP